MSSVRGKFPEASSGTSGRADDMPPICLEEFVTRKTGVDLRRPVLSWWEHYANFRLWKCGEREELFSQGSVTLQRIGFKTGSSFSPEKHPNFSLCSNQSVSLFVGELPKNVFPKCKDTWLFVCLRYTREFICTVKQIFWVWSRWLQVRIPRVRLKSKQLNKPTSVSPGNLPVEGTLPKVAKSSSFVNISWERDTYVSELTRVWKDGP